MNTLCTIAASVLVGLLVAGAIYIIKARFAEQPKIRIRFLLGPRSSNSGFSGNIKITWYISLELYNSTGFRALDLEFISASQKLPFRLPSIEPPHLDATEIKVFKFEIVREFAPKTVTSCRDRFKELCPEELRKFYIILSYRNEKGKRFYTRYVRDGGEGSSSYYRIQPQIEDT